MIRHPQYLLVACICLCLCAIYHRQTLEPFSDGMLPFSNPISSKFFIVNNHTYRVSALPSQDISRLVGSYSRSAPAPSDIAKLDRYELDFAVKLELDAFRQYRRSHTNVRLIAPIYTLHVVMITPNDSNIVEFSDIGRYSCKVNILVTSRRDHQCLRHILANYSATLRSQVNVVMSSDLRAQYLDASPAVVYFTMTSDLHRSPNLTTLTQALPSHLVAPRIINDGTYHITDAQRPFYSRYPYYHKAMVDLQRYRRLYPMLTTVPSVSRTMIYMPTIKTSYVLLCHDRISVSKVREIMGNITRDEMVLNDGHSAHIAIPLHSPAGASAT
jgi:hypothetical protein